MIELERTETRSDTVEKFILERYSDGELKDRVWLWVSEYKDHIVVSDPHGNIKRIIDKELD